MYYCHRVPGLGLILLGLLIGTAGIVHTYHAGSHRAQFEQHVAEVCIKAANQVQK